MQEALGKRCERTGGAEGLHLGIELDIGSAEAHKAREEGLVEVAVLLEGHVLDHGRQLVVVAYQNHPLEPRHTFLLVLHKSPETMEGVSDMPGV